MKTIYTFFFIFILASLQAQSLIGLIGTAVPGWEEDAESDNYSILAYPDINGNYYFNAVELEDGYVKFVELDNPDTIFGGSTFPSGEFSDNEIPVSAGLYTIELFMDNNTYFFDVYPKVYMGFYLQKLFESENQVNFELPATEFSTGFSFIKVHTYPGLMESDELGSNSFPQGVANEGHPIPIEAGYYKVLFNYETLFYSFEIPQVSLVGSAVNGWPDEQTENADVFLESEDGFIYTLAEVFLEEGEVKFRQDSSWDVSWSGSGFPEGDLVSSDLDAILVNQSGVYNVVFNRQDETFSFETLSATDFDSSSIEIYPNPSQNSWFVHTGSIVVGHIQIFAITGKLLLNQEVDHYSNQAIEIDASSLSKGVYLAKLHAESGEVITRKLIKN